MKTFDEILPQINAILRARSTDVSGINKLIINRDLNGRIRLLADESVSANVKNILNTIAEDISIVLGNRIPKTNRVLYEPSLDAIIKDAPCSALHSFPNVIVVDRLLGETNWGDITPVTPNTHRIVFYSIKGGVGRSTALAAAAWALAEEGKKVLVMDMDLESPGISSSLLSPEKAPKYGIVDWLVEDLIDNGSEVFPSMFSVSDLSHNGEILVVPSYGKEPGEYISKIGRVWMPKHKTPNNRELWQSRLNRLIRELETQHRPDVVLIDSRAGIDEIASACITSLGAESVLLFSIDSFQTWDGYKMLFDHWHRTGAVKKIREPLQIVGALVPEINQSEYIDGLCEHSWDLFTEQLYDDIPSGNTDTDLFNFDMNDTDAPHYPRIVRWNRGFEALPNLYQPLMQQTEEQIRNIFGNLIDFIAGIIRDEY